MMTHACCPPFRPHPLLRSGHLQTLAAFASPKADGRSTRRHFVQLDDGDQVVLHDDCPVGWPSDGPVVLLVHGLSGSHASSYMVRVGRRLYNCGIRTFRMDLRTCGAGAGLARLPYHSGRSEDVRAAMSRIQALCPDSPLGLLGFSLGGNMVLKLLGEQPALPSVRLLRAAAVCPPVDLAACVRNLQRPLHKPYDRYFAGELYKHALAGRRARPDMPAIAFRRKPRTLYEFDDVFTAPACGFGTANRYYACCSSAQFMHGIGIPTLVLAAEDDPLVPIAPLLSVSASPKVHLLVTRHGGHMGFIGRAGTDPDRRWMDWRLVDWLMQLKPPMAESS